MQNGRYEIGDSVYVLSRSSELPAKIIGKEGDLFITKQVFSDGSLGESKGRFPANRLTPRRVD